MYAELEILWNYSASAVLTPLVWGAFAGLAALAGLLALWLISRRRGWLQPPSGRAWPRRLVLVIWLVALVPLAGVGGLAYGAQRATVKVLEQTKVISGSCAMIARGLVRAATVGADPAKSPERIPVGDLRALWDDTNTQIDHLEDRGVDAVVSAGSSEDGTAEATALVVRWGLDALRAKVASTPSGAVEPLLEGLETHAAADGTVGAPEAVAWLSDEYLEPVVRGFIVGLFRPYYQLAWGTGLLGVILPFAMLGLWRRRSRGMAAPVVPAALPVVRPGFPPRTEPSTQAPGQPVRWTAEPRR